MCVFACVRACARECVRACLCVCGGGGGGACVCRQNFALFKYYSNKIVNILVFLSVDFLFIFFWLVSINQTEW